MLTTADDVLLVKADWTNRDPEITQMLHAFGRPGVPLYVVFSGGQAEAPIVLPEVITTEIVLEATGLTGPDLVELYNPTDDALVIEQSRRIDDLSGRVLPALDTVSVE